MFDLPKAYAYAPGIEGAQLLSKILRFFEEYEGLITSYRKNLQETDTSDLGFYLDPRRPSINLCNSRKGPFFNVFPSLDLTELKTDWVSLEIINLLERKFVTNEETDGFSAELENNIFLLSMVDGFADESLNIGNLTMTRLIDTAKKILFFKERCEAIIAAKALPSEIDNEHRISALFDEQCQTVLGVPKAIKRMLERERTKQSHKDEKFTEDRTLLISFFTELFRETLTNCLFKFGLTSEKLETLKKIASPLQQELEGGKEALGISIQPINTAGTSQSLTGPQEYSEVTLHVPVDFSRNSQISSEKAVPFSSSAQLQKEDDADLPPVKEFNLPGESLF